MKYLMLALTLVGGSIFGAELDTQKSEFKWEGTKKVGSGHFGRIFLKSAKLNTEGDTVTGGEFVMDMASFTVDNLEGEWEKKFLAHMKSNDFFKIESYPTSTLVISSLNNGLAKGNLTILGKTHAVEFPIEQQGNVYQGVLTFDRTKFGMVYGSDDFFKNLGDKVINNEVSLTFKAVIK